MSLPPEKQDSKLMRAMFGTIAPRYDFITRAFSYGMDRGNDIPSVALRRQGNDMIDNAAGERS